MKWGYLIVWVILMICMGFASSLHEEKMAKDPMVDRVGFWERLWYGTGCISIFQFFESIW